MITGIIAEFNPFHNGHEYLIKKAKQNSDAVICVMSGNFMQRGDIAIYDKYTRTVHALSCGADLVILLPSAWSMSCAENFALGGVSLLKSCRVADNIAFGCEDVDLPAMKEIADLRDSADFNEKIKTYLSSGCTYAAAFEMALGEISHDYKKIVSKPNNVLGIEYIYAAKKLDYNVEFTPICRIGTQHDSSAAKEGFMSASAIRNCITNGKIDIVKDYVPQAVFNDIKSRDFSKIDNIDTALLYHLKSKPKEYFANLADINEGLENRIYEKIKTAKSFNQLIESVCTKRYTTAHIRRLLLSAAFDIDSSSFKNTPPYIKILGYNNTGKSLISKISKNAELPIILTAGDYNQLTGYAKAVFERDMLSNDLYGMSYDTPVNSSCDLTTCVIKV